MPVEPYAVMNVALERHTSSSLYWFDGQAYGKLIWLGSDTYHAVRRTVEQCELSKIKIIWLDPKNAGSHIVGQLQTLNFTVETIDPHHPTEQRDWIAKELRSG